MSAGLEEGVGGGWNREEVRVLLVEDNPAEARLVLEMLREAVAVRFRVDQARSVADFAARSGRIDVILLDLSLPDAQGLDTFAEVRARAEAPVVVVSGHDDEALAARAVDLGAQDYLVKGRFDGEGLIRAVRYALGRHHLMAERRAAERALRESERRYRRFFERDLTGDCVARPDGRIVACNPAFAEIFGFPSVSEAIRAGLGSLLTAENLSALLDELGREGRAERFEIPGRRRDGRTVYLVGNAVANLREDGKLEDFHAYLFDDTERVRAREQLLQSQKMEAVGRLAGGVAHDFSNILTAMTLHADYLIAKLPPKSPLRSRAEQIKQASRQASNLTSQLLAFSRRQVLRPQVLDLNTVVEQVQSLFQRIIGEHIRVVATLQDDLGRVRADPSQIEQVILNLVVNARDAMPDGGRLEIETRNVSPEQAAVAGLETAGPHVALRVSDTGEGMDEEVKANIFEPFFTTKERGKGTGLGLSSVYGIVHQSRGQVMVDSLPGRGTTFEIYLPLVEGDADPRPPEIEPESAADGETVMVIEDEAALRGLVLEVLRRHGYQGLGASSGEAALDLVRSHRGPIHLAVIDLVMPDCRGPDLLARLRIHRPGLRCLFMSGYVDDATVREREDTARIPFIEKPFSGARLLRSVESVLADPPAD